MAKLNPVKEGFKLIENTGNLEYKWMNKNTVKISKEGTTSGVQVKFEKFVDGSEYIVRIKENSNPIWLAIAILREDSQDPLEFKYWMTRMGEKLNWGEYN